jgi:hypothetical protein
VIPVLLVLGLIASVRHARRCPPEQRRTAWTAVALLGLGALHVLPSFLRPYFHYFACSLPFAVLAVAACLRALRHERALASATAVGVLLFAARPTLPYAEHFFLHPGSVPPMLDYERAMAASMKPWLDGATPAFVAPDVPQYYVHCGIMPLPGNGNLFNQTEDEIRTVLAAKAPAFIIQRDLRDLTFHEGAFRANGYVRVARWRDAQAWWPREKAAARGQKEVP